MAHSDKTKAEVLALLDANGGNLSQTARDAGLPISTVQSWRDGRFVTQEVTENSKEKKVELADMFERVAWKYLGEADKDHKAEETRGKDAVMTAAIATDKMRLLREQTTQNIGPTVSPHQIVMDFIASARRKGLTTAQIIEGLEVLSEVDRSVREEARLMLTETVDNG
jgi:transposase-like protein